MTTVLPHIVRWCMRDDDELGGHRRPQRESLRATARAQSADLASGSERLDCARLVVVLFRRVFEANLRRQQDGPTDQARDVGIERFEQLFSSRNRQGSA